MTSYLMTNCWKMYLLPIRAIQTGVKMMVEMMGYYNRKMTGGKR